MLFSDIPTPNNMANVSEKPQRIDEQLYDENLFSHRYLYENSMVNASQHPSNNGPDKFGDQGYKPSFRIPEKFLRTSTED